MEIQKSWGPDHSVETPYQFGLPAPRGSLVAPGFPFSGELPVWAGADPHRRLCSLRVQRPCLHLIDGKTHSELH